MPARPAIAPPTIPAFIVGAAPAEVLEPWRTPGPAAELRPVAAVTEAVLVAVDEAMVRVVVLDSVLSIKVTDADTVPVLLAAITQSVSPHYSRVENILFEVAFCVTVVLTSIVVSTTT